MAKGGNDLSTLPLRGMERHVSDIKRGEKAGRERLEGRGVKVEEGKSAVSLGCQNLSSR